MKLQFSVCEMFSLSMVHIISATFRYRTQTYNLNRKGYNKERGLKKNPRYAEKSEILFSVSV